MTADVLARRYASALIDLAVEEKAQDEVSDQLAAFAAQLEASGLEKVLVDPALGAEEKTKVLAEVVGSLKLNKVLKNFLHLLLDNKRIASLPSINEVFQVLIDEKVGRIKAEVVLPEKATKEELEQITKGLEASTGKKVIIDVSVDPSIVGGVVARVGSLVYDGSIRTQLENIKNNIMRG